MDVARVNTDGSIDQSFGKVTLPDTFTGQSTGGLDSNGNILLTGSVQTAGGNRSVLIERLTGNGRPPSISLDPRSHILTVKGTSGDDSISIEDDGLGRLKVFNNHLARVFKSSDVQKLSITTG